MPAEKRTLGFYVLAAFFLLLSLLTQGFAATVQASALAAGDLEHAVMHWTVEGHHHHDDGSIAQDDSDESIRHLAADNGVPVVALIPVPWSGLPPLPPALQRPPLVAALPPPFLDGPERPPRLTT